MSLYALIYFKQEIRSKPFRKESILDWGDFSNLPAAYSRFDFHLSKSRSDKNYKYRPVAVVDSKKFTVYRYNPDYAANVADIVERFKELL